MSGEYRNKTQKLSSSAHASSDLDVSGALALGFYEKTFQFLSNDAENVLKRPWHKLERGLRIGRIREFVAAEKQRLQLHEEDVDALFKLLLKGLDRKVLSSKAAVTYDSATEKITEIKGLLAHTGANGRTKFQLFEKKSGGTLKRRAPLKEPPTVNRKEVDEGSSSKNESREPT